MKPTTEDGSWDNNGWEGDVSSEPWEGVDARAGKADEWSNWENEDWEASAGGGSAGKADVSVIGRSRRRPSTSQQHQAQPSWSTEGGAAAGRTRRGSTSAERRTTQSVSSLEQIELLLPGPYRALLRPTVLVLALLAVVLMALMVSSLIPQVRNANHFEVVPSAGDGSMAAAGLQGHAAEAEGGAQAALRAQVAFQSRLAQRQGPDAAVSRVQERAAGAALATGQGSSGQLVEEAAELQAGHAQLQQGLLRGGHHWATERPRLQRAANKATQAELDLIAHQLHAHGLNTGSSTKWLSTNHLSRIAGGGSAAAAGLGGAAVGSHGSKPDSSADLLAQAGSADSPAASSLASEPTGSDAGVADATDSTSEPWSAARPKGEVVGTLAAGFERDGALVEAGGRGESTLQGTWRAQDGKQTVAKPHGSAGLAAEAAETGDPSDPKLPLRGGAGKRAEAGAAAVVGTAGSSVGALGVEARSADGVEKLGVLSSSRQQPEERNSSAGVVGLESDAAAAFARGAEEEEAWKDAVITADDKGNGVQSGSAGSQGYGEQELEGERNEAGFSGEDGAAVLREESLDDTPPQDVRLTARRAAPSQASNQAADSTVLDPAAGAMAASTAGRPGDTDRPAQQRLGTAAAVAERGGALSAVGNTTVSAKDGSRAKKRGKEAGPWRSEGKGSKRRASLPKSSRPGTAIAAEAQAAMQNASAASSSSEGGTEQLSGGSQLLNPRSSKRASGSAVARGSDLASATAAGKLTAALAYNSSSFEGGDAHASGAEAATTRSASEMGKQQQAGVLDAWSRSGEAEVAISANGFQQTSGYDTAAAAVTTAAQLSGSHSAGGETTEAGATQQLPLPQRRDEGSAAVGRDAESDRGGSRSSDGEFGGLQGSSRSSGGDSVSSGTAGDADVISRATADGEDATGEISNLAS